MYRSKDALLLIEALSSYQESNDVFRQALGLKKINLTEMKEEHLFMFYKKYIPNDSSVKCPLLRDLCLDLINLAKDNNCLHLTRLVARDLEFWLNQMNIPYQTKCLHMVKKCLQSDDLNSLTKVAYLISPTE